MAATVVSNWAAISDSVSPLATVYLSPGSGLGAGVKVGGSGVAVGSTVGAGTVGEGSSVGLGAAVGV